MHRKNAILTVLLLLLTACTPAVKTDASNSSIPTTPEYSTSQLGRNPGMFNLVSHGDTIFYKSFVNLGDEKLYRCLYSKNLDGTGKKLLCTDFGQYLNYYNNSLYFTDTENRLVQLDLSTLQTAVFDGDDNSTVGWPLIIHDVLYYLRSNKEGDTTLIAYSFKAKKSVEVAKDVNARYLSNFKDSVCFVRKNEDFDSPVRNICTWDFDSKKNVSQGSIDMEMMQMLDDGSIIGCTGNSFTKSQNGKAETLVSIENINKRDARR